MGTRLYQDFMDKCKVPKVQRTRVGITKNQTEEKEKEICITIPLKGGSGVSFSFSFFLKSRQLNWMKTSLRLSSMNTLSDT